MRTDATTILPPLFFYKTNKYTLKTKNIYLNDSQANSKTAPVVSSKTVLINQDHDNTQKTEYKSNSGEKSIVCTKSSFFLWNLGGTCLTSFIEARGQLSESTINLSGAGGEKETLGIKEDTDT